MQERIKQWSLGLTSGKDMLVLLQLTRLGLTKRKKKGAHSVKHNEESSHAQ